MFTGSYTFDRNKDGQVLSVTLADMKTPKRKIGSSVALRVDTECETITAPCGTLRVFGSGIPKSMPVFRKCIS
jgi:hypothetical protein